MNISSQVCVTGSTTPEGHLESASSAKTHCGLAQVSLLYRTEKQMMMPASSGASKYNLQVADSLPSIGIMHSMTTG